MNREVIEFTNEAHWLAEREKDVTSTESSALFGASPYATAYELWHRKTGQLPVEFEANERMKWGNRLESAIAYGVGEDLGLVVEPFKVYIRLPDHRIGSSFDFKVVGLDPNYHGEENVYRDLFRQHGPGILEVKNVDGLAFKRGWLMEGDDVEAPPHIEFQVQHQMLVAGMAWCCVAPLVAGNTPRPFHRIFDDNAGKAIVKKVDAFWSSIDAGTPPAPDYARDSDAIAALLVNDNGEEVDMTDDLQLAVLCAEHKDAAAAEQEASNRKSALKGEIMERIGEAAKVICAGYKISAKTRAGSPGKVITEDMIGETIGARKASRFPTITPIK